MCVNSASGNIELFILSKMAICFIQLVNTQSQQIELYSTHKNWTSGQGINVLMERTIIMTQGASKVTSTHKNLIKGANRFFQSTAKKLSRQYKNS